MELSQVVLFGLVLPEPEKLMEPWLREVDKALGDEEIVEAVMTAMRGRWRQSEDARARPPKWCCGCWRSNTCATGATTSYPPPD
jgi:hypothetical protein